jgi:Ser/Thr protein kinase RdoA (MazF antagonist)
VAAVAEVIRDQIARNESGLAVIHEAIHGSLDPTVIAGRLDEFVDKALGSTINDGLFHIASVGSVTGVVLRDGREVVIKAYQPRWSHRFLSAVVEAQGALADAGLACARPLAGPSTYGTGLATIESLLIDPGQPTTFGPAEMASSARGLGDLIAAAPELPELADNPLQRPFTGLYPQPHSPAFDFVATARGAEWIDELASRARPFLDTGRQVVAHTDWAARNIRLGPTGLRAIYDIDSLAVVPLSKALGIAAATWRSTGERTDDAAPGVAEIDAWLALYPVSLTATDVQAVFAHALYALAYSSRCEHAVDPDECLHQRARTTLRGEASEFLKRLPADT